MVDSDLPPCAGRSGVHWQASESYGNLWFPWWRDALRLEALDPEAVDCGNTERSRWLARVRPASPGGHQCDRSHHAAVTDIAVHLYIVGL